MPLNQNVLKIFACSLALVLSMAAYSQFDHSEETKTPLFEKIVKTKKLQAPTSVKIRITEDREVTADKVYTLEATVKSPRSFGNVSYHWQAPNGVVFLGYENGAGDTIVADEDKIIKIQFRQTDGENKRIRLVINDDAKLGVIGRGTFNTTRERAIAEENKELLERQEIYLEENPDVIKDIKGAHSH